MSYGRAKKPYSIWRKMQEKELAFSRLSDIYGFRIIDWLMWPNAHRC